MCTAAQPRGANLVVSRRSVETNARITPAKHTLSESYEIAMFWQRMPVLVGSLSAEKRLALEFHLRPKIAKREGSREKSSQASFDADTLCSCSVQDDW